MLVVATVGLYASRMLQYPLFTAFDGPHPELCPPQQHHHADAGLDTIERRLRPDAGPSAGPALLPRDDRIRAAYLAVLGREPSPAERTAAQRFLAKQSQLIGADEALTDLCHALLNSAEFLYVE